MPGKVRIAIVGAGTLRGKELAEALEESAFAAADVILMDEDDSLGVIEAIGDEVTVVQTIDDDSFTHVDYVFFAGEAAQTRTHWQAAVEARASIIDLSAALENEPGVLVAAPWVRDATDDSSTPVPDLHTPALVPAHVAATALALLLARAQDASPVRSAWATVHEPASEHGRAAVDELHQQTVTLLNFQSMPKDVHDMQIAFNLTPALGEASQIDLQALEARIRRHYALVSGRQLPQLGVQLVQTPAFHGYVFSLALELERPVAPETLEAALAGDHVDVVMGEVDPPSNLSCAGQDDVFVRVRPAETGEGPTTRFWIWAALDNLKFGSLHAIACAAELGKLRPRGKVQ